MLNLNPALTILSFVEGEFRVIIPKDALYPKAQVTKEEGKVKWEINRHGENSYREAPLWA